MVTVMLEDATKLPGGSEPRGEVFNAGKHQNLVGVGHVLPMI